MTLSEWMNTGAQAEYMVLHAPMTPSDRLAAVLLFGSGHSVTRDAANRAKIAIALREDMGRAKVLAIAASCDAADRAKIAIESPVLTPSDRVYLGCQNPICAHRIASEAPDLQSDERLQLFLAHAGQSHGYATSVPEHL